MFTKYKKLLAGALLAVGASMPVSAALVDIEMSLVIDISGSVNTSEYNLQMDGYANAFRNASVQQNIINSVNGIAVNVVFFASNFFTTSLDAFSILTSAADANAFADTLDNFVRPGSGGTNIYQGVNRAVDLLENNGLDATVSSIIDVSGDGTDSVGLNQAARDNAVSLGYVVNGIAIGGSAITNFYRDNVIGGAGSFVIEAASFDEFEAGIIRKLEIETNTGPTPVSSPAVFLLVLVTAGGLLVRRKL